MSRTSWQSLAVLQQEQRAETSPAEPQPTEPQPTEPPETINEVGQAAIDLLKRWQAHTADDNAAINTILAVFGKHKSPGSMVSRWRPIPGHLWLADIAHDNGARLTDLGDGKARRSTAAAEMIRWRIAPGDTRLKPMGFQTHAALLRYWREHRELLHELRALGSRHDARHLGLMIRSVAQLVTKLEALNIRMMSHLAQKRRSDGQ